MILYFSGTGNSRYAAQVIQSVTNDEIVSINGLMKNGAAEAIRSERPLVFVAPIYAWRIPRVVGKFLRAASFEGCKKAYFVVTCASEAGNAAHYAKKLCDAKGLEFMGFAAVDMPENYVALMGAPDKDTSERMIRVTTPQIFALAESIGREARIGGHRPSFCDILKSSLINPLFYLLAVKSKPFRATDRCAGCGKCAALCPLNNIEIKEGRPAWKGHCTHCMACICGCPEEAIEYGRRTVGKRRYYNEGYRAGTETADK